MKSITVCVEYDDFLAVTLPRNAPHFEKMLVVTAPHDKRTAGIVASVPNAELYVTDAFYKDSCAFNKAAALEEGFDVLGRDGWLMMLDADIILPLADLAWWAAFEPPPPHSRLGAIHGPRRHMVRNPLEYAAVASGELDEWDHWPLHPDQELAGYCVIFHADDPALAKRPWLDTRWKHAGGYDSFFQQRWPRDKRVRAPWNVLHLGDDGANWHGRWTDRLDGKTTERAGQRKAAQQQMQRHRKERNGFDGELLT